MTRSGGSSLERVKEVLFRHLEDAHGFRGLRLEVKAAGGEPLAYRILPAPYSGGHPDAHGESEALKLRLVPLDEGGRPRATGARRLDVAAARTAVGDALDRAVSGWVASATRTQGFESRFGPAEEVSLAFRSVAAVAPRIPLEEPGPRPAPPAPVPRPERACALPGTNAAAGVDDLLPPDEAGPLLEALGLLAPGGGQVRRDERRKYNQIAHFLRLLDAPLRRLPTDREVLVVDGGCGKSQLLFVLNYWLTERLGRRAFFVGLDVEARAVTTASRLQASLGYRNMRFVETSIAGWEPPAPPDVVLSLHACDTATDEAIALGVRSRSAVIIAVPCCQHELAGQARQELFDPVFRRHPILLDRFGDWLTDSLRVLALEAQGYAVDVVEYVSPLDTPKNIMLRAEKARRPERRAYAQYLALRDLFGVQPALDRLLAGTWPERPTP